MGRPLVRLLVVLALASVVACSDDGSERPAAAEDDPTSSVVMEATAPSRSRAGNRPELHYTPPFGWMNDPNGLSRVGDRWHLFFQYNPYSIDFGNIGWGHAVSDDLVDWETWPVAIEPEGLHLIFSGSLVADPASPVCEGEEVDGCMVAVYTTHRSQPEGVVQTQDLAVSRDGGRTFAKYEGNPVLDLSATDFRDPKVFFHEETGRWIMVVVLPLEHQVVLFGSDDLVAWTELSRFGPAGSTEGIWECPDLFPLPVVDDDRTVGTRWVMKVYLNPGHIAGGSGAQYFVGSFDGTVFVPDAEQALPRWVDWGTDFYCATTFHDGDDEEGRQTWLGWMNNWSYAGELPTYPWRGSMTVPRQLWLVPDQDGSVPELAQAPVLPERDVAKEQVAAGVIDLPAGAQRLDVSSQDGGALTLLAGDVEVATVEWNFDEGIRVLRETAGNRGPDGFATSTPFAPLSDRAAEFSVVVDAGSVEVFANGGRTVVTSLLVPVGDIDRLSVSGDGVSVELTDLAPD